MPLYLLLMQDKYGHHTHSILLCTFKNLKLLLRKRKGIENPKQYGKILFSGHGIEPNEVIQYILKEKYDFDIKNCAMQEILPGGPF